jgi:CRP/FNR family cyclic AMP-dependent transcriptional regulator
MKRTLGARIGQHNYDRRPLVRLELDATPPVREDVLQSRQSFDVEAFAARHSGVTVSKFKPGAALFAQGERANCLFYVHRGRVGITIVSTEGREANIGVVDTGHFCGEGCLIGDRTRVATATCIEDSTIARMERGTVIRALRQDQLFTDVFVGYLLSSVVQLREALLSQLIESSDIRLARVLVKLANCGTGSDERAVITNVSQESLAHMVGTTRARVNYFMNKFRKLGYIDYDGEIIVHKSLLKVIPDRN